MKWFRNKVARAIITSFFPVVVGIITSFFANNSSSNLLKIAMGVSALLWITINIVYACLDNSEEKKRKLAEEEKKALQNEVEAANEIAAITYDQVKDYENAMSSIIELCRVCSERTNQQVHAIYKSTKIERVQTVFNFPSAANLACKAVYQGIIKDSQVRLENEDEGSPDVEVTYIRIKEPTQEEWESNSIALVGYYHPTRTAGKSKGRYSTITELKGKKHYAKLFAGDIDESETILEQDRLVTAFGENTDISQYFAIPVRCPTIEDKTKLVGILQLACKSGVKLAADENGAKYIVDHLLSTYSHLILLLHKLDKALYAVPMEKGDLSDGKN